MKNRALLLYSGGIDSTLAALILAEKNIELIGLSISYVGRPEEERSAAIRNAEILAFEELIEISIDSKHVFTRSEYRSTAYEGWIPYRNLLFWSIAATFAVLESANIIAAGHHRWDGKTFNDASKQFFKELEKLLKFNGNAGLSSNIKCHLPLLTVTERYIDGLVVANGSVIKNTWSCWRNLPSPCLECKACDERNDYLREIGGI